MSEKRLFVFATISPKEEHYTEAKQAIINIIQQTREESGCHQFELHESPSEGNLFLYEEWESEQALAEHYEKPYIVDVFEQYKEWLAAPVNIVKMQKC
ncbi:MAG: putative quinol monooxygenase [Alphaproteobacteria bacterium]